MRRELPTTGGEFDPNGTLDGQMPGMADGIYYTRNSGLSYSGSDIDVRMLPTGSAPDKIGVRMRVEPEPDYPPDFQPVLYLNFRDPTSPYAGYTVSITDIQFSPDDSSWTSFMGPGAWNFVSTDPDSSWDGVAYQIDFGGQRVNNWFIGQAGVLADLWTCTRYRAFFTISDPTVQTWTALCRDGEDCYCEVAYLSTSSGFQTGDVVVFDWEVCL